MNEVWAQYGVLGLAVIGLGAYIVRIEQRHKKERDEWRITIEKQFDKLDERSEETNKTTRETGNILTGLKTLLENRNKR